MGLSDTAYVKIPETVRSPARSSDSVDLVLLTSLQLGPIRK
jgi:hypothetical protein